MTVILGLNAYHGDAAAALLVDGQWIMAAEEERFRRIKHWAGFPSQAIAACLEAADLTLDQVDHVAVNRDPSAARWLKIIYTLSQRPSPALVMERLKNRKAWSGIEGDLAQAFPSHDFSGHGFTGQVHFIEHHLAHLASAFLVSPFDKAAILSIDGFGDFASTAWGLGQDAQVTLARRIHFPHSLGIFYQAMTQYLGFHHYGDEYKVMGLAPYGEDSFPDEMAKVLHLNADGFALNLAYFRHHRENVPYEWKDGEPSVGRLYSGQLERLLGPARQPDAPLEQKHKDLAKSVQRRFEQAVFHIAQRLYDRSGVEALALAGGCAFNSVANGKLVGETPFKQLYVQSAAGDAGGAIGAAAQLYAQITHKRPQAMAHAAWGPAFSDQDMATLLTEAQGELEASGCRMIQARDDASLCREVAQALADGQVVGWFQGRMEWGPRALGNRSILGDPRRADMKDILNLKIKRRESFRPFAPSILQEAVGEWFEKVDEVPFMMKVFPIRPERRKAIPAVTHVDGSGRLQTVSATHNPLYHQLISAFAKITGVPMLLNTSFNENEPVVCRPQEALACFLRTRMDMLVLGRHIIKRSTA